MPTHSALDKEEVSDWTSFMFFNLPGGSFTCPDVRTVPALPVLHEGVFSINQIKSPSEPDMAVCSTLNLASMSFTLISLTDR